MPELPEVETTRRGIAPHIEGKRVKAVVLRERRLRYPVPAALARELPGRRIERVERRAKYLLLHAGTGAVIIHLGMSGSLRLVAADAPVKKHDHVDVVMVGGMCLRLHDPRRFGAVLWTDGDPLEHDLLSRLGPEPLADTFTGDYLYERSRGRQIAVKLLIMDNHVVVGVGNIYANEALFLAGIRPQTPAEKVSRRRYQALAAAIQTVLRAAISQGGTTLRDFVNDAGKPGYFQQRLNVYGRGGEACRRCSTVIKRVTMGQRSTCYCPRCQR